MVYPTHIEKRAAPPVLMARVSSGVWSMYPTKPATNIDSREVYRNDPMLVKSDLVVRAKAVRANVTAAVIPRASSTMSVWYRAVQTPTKTPSPMVKMPIRIMFLGNS